MFMMAAASLLFLVAADCVSVGGVAVADVLDMLRNRATEERGKELIEKIGPAHEAAVPLLAAALRDSEYTVRRCAARALYRIGEASIPAIIHALDPKDTEQATTLGMALKPFGPKAAPAIPALIEALKTLSEGVSDSATAALSSIGPEAIPAVVELLRWQESWRTEWDTEAYRRSSIKDAAGSVIAGMGEAAIEPLVRILQGGDADRARAAAEGLGTMREDGLEARPVLEKALGHKAPRVRVTAAWSLYWLGFRLPEVIPVMVGCLEDSQPEVRYRAASLLGFLRRRAVSATPALAKLLEDPDWHVRSVAAAALGSVGAPKDQALLPLLGAVGDDQARVRERVVTSIGELWPPARESVSFLKHAATDKDFEVRVAALLALARVGAPPHEVVPHVRSVLATTSVEGREDLDTAYSTALDALDVLGDGGRAAVPWLVAFIREHAGYTADCAMTLLQRLAPEDPSFQSALVALLVRERSCDAAVTTLTALGPTLKPVLPELVRVLRESEGPRLRQIAGILAAMGPSASDAVPALQDALIREASKPNAASVDMRGRAVAKALAAIGRPAVPAIRVVLRHRDDMVRGRAHAAIDEMGPEAADLIPDLVRLLRTPWAHAALRNLTAIGPAAKAAVPALAEGIRTFEPPADRDVFEDCGFYRYACALAAIGPASKETLPVLRELMKRAHPFEAVLVHALIGTLTETEIEEARRIVELMRAHPRETWTSGELAFRMFGATALPVLLEMLSPDDERICTIALNAVDRLGASAARAAAARLAPVLRDKRFQYDALGLVCKIGPAAGNLVPTLVTCLKERSHVERVLLALASIGPAAHSATPAIEPFLTEEKFKYSALVALEKIGPGARSAVAKVAALDDPEGQKSRTLVAIGAEPDVLMPIVLKAIERPIPGARYAAGCHAVAHLGPRAREALPLLADRHLDMFAIRALAAIGPAASRAAEAIAAVLWDASQYYAGSPQFAVLCCEALGKIGLPEAGARPVLEALRRAAEHQNPEIRAAARTALEQVSTRP